MIKAQREIRYCQVELNRADRAPTYKVHDMTRAHHFAVRSAEFSSRLTVSMISLPDGVTCDTGGCQ